MTEKRYYLKTRSGQRGAWEKEDQLSRLIGDAMFFKATVYAQEIDLESGQWLGRPTQVKFNYMTGEVL